LKSKLRQGNFREADVRVLDEEQRYENGACTSHTTRRFLCAA